MTNNPEHLKLRAKRIEEYAQRTLSEHAVGCECDNQTHGEGHVPDCPYEQAYWDAWHEAQHAIDELYPIEER